MKKLKTTAQFIQDARKIHGNKYDYTLAEYTGSKKHLKIICTEHGIFNQSASNHLRGQGCPACAKKSRIDTRTNTTQQFIEKAKLIHGDQYDYQLTNYLGCHKSLLIICRLHGVFKQSATSHLSGRGCHKCGRIASDTKRFKGTEQFIKDAQRVHGNKYDYSLANYIGSHGKVKITCPCHGTFYQSATKHLSGDGCPACGTNSSIKNRTKTTSEFVAEARLAHGDKYDYSHVNYISNKSKVKIICPNHGEFQQTAVKHLKENGCPMCAPRGFDYNAPAIIYFIKFEKPFVSFWKVGVTNKSIRSRFGGEFEFITNYYQWDLQRGSDAYRIEQKTLEKFKKYQFDKHFLFKLLQFGGDTECLSPNAPHNEIFQFIDHLAADCNSSATCRANVLL